MANPKRKCVVLVPIHLQQREERLVSRRRKKKVIFVLLAQHKGGKRFWDPPHTHTQQRTRMVQILATNDFENQIF
jgi:hypothetical protein